MKRMRLELKNSTLHGYEMFLGTWATPHWKDRLIRSTTREDVFLVVHEKTDGKLTAYSKKTLLKHIKRIFRIAMEECHIDRNPAMGVKVHVPEVEQKVLTLEEVRSFLGRRRQLGIGFIRCGRWLCLPECAQASCLRFFGRTLILIRS